MDHFARQLLDWFDQHGRHDLPWQNDPTPYRVWISEIMLQQTQVATVLPYFNRFMTRFQRIEQLADAPQDEVLHLWSGLGYYSRARNLHKTAKILATDRNGEFPNKLADLESLPGIGRSTAGAILSLAMQRPTPILDGNVKRVLVRYHCIEGWTGNAKTQKALWSLASIHLPTSRARDYTQAIMDLGATLCAARKPSCERCPFQVDCLARQQGKVDQLPTPKPRKKLPIRSTRMVILQNRNAEILLQKRPSTGIWGGLWVFPELDKADEFPLEPLLSKWGLSVEDSIDDIHLSKPWTEFRHTFSHFRLDIVVYHVQLTRTPAAISDHLNQAWYPLASLPEIGLPQPILKLIKSLQEHQPIPRTLMSRTVFCRRLKQELPGLERPPFPGQRGQEIYENTSAEAWTTWQDHQTMIINERNLNMMDKEARKFLNEEMERFLNGEETAQIEGFVPVEKPE